MHKEGPYNQAEKIIPQSWYEQAMNRRDIEQRIFYGMLDYSIIYIGSSAINLTLTGEYALWPHIVSGGLYFVSSIFDRGSTAIGINARNLSAKMKVDHRVVEQSPLLADVSDPNKIVFHPKASLVDLLATGAAFLFPGFGLPIAAVKTMAAANNIRLSRRLKLATRIAAQER